MLMLALAALGGCNKDTSDSPTNGGGTAATGGDHGAGERPSDDDSTHVAANSSTTDGADSTNGASHPPNGSEAGSDQASKAADAGPAAPPGKQPAAPGKTPAPRSGSQAAPPPEISKPEVILSQHHAQTCVIGVGDSFPAIALPDLEGNQRELSQLYGDRMTIVVFWTAKGLYAREQFSRIMQEAATRYEPMGVKVVAINVGDSPEVVQELATKHQVTIPCLLDADGQAFAQVATGLLPRTYLLDAEGRVLWFDLEYSRGQRLGLNNAIFYQLKQTGA
jgi:peroxiredoxin